MWCQGSHLGRQMRNGVGSVDDAKARYHGTPRRCPCWVARARVAERDWRCDINTTRSQVEERNLSNRRAETVPRHEHGRRRVRGQGEQRSMQLLSEGEIRAEEARMDFAPGT